MQPSERRAQLVGCIGYEAAMRGQRAVQARQQTIDGIHQRSHFPWRLPCRHRAQVLVGAAANFFAQALERVQAAPHPVPHSHRCERNQHALGQQRGEQDSVR